MKRILDSSFRYQPSYATDLKSMTAGRGSYTMEFRSHEPVPPNVQQTIIVRWTKSRAGAEEE